MIVGGIMCAQGWRPGSDKGCTYGVYADASALPWDKLQDDMMRVAVNVYHIPRSGI